MRKVVYENVFYKIGPNDCDDELYEKLKDLKQVKIVINDKVEDVFNIKFIE